jgi:hypothetical protein
MPYTVLFVGISTIVVAPSPLVASSAAPSALVVGMSSPIPHREQQVSRQPMDMLVGAQYI